MTDRYTPINIAGTEFEPLTDWEASTGSDDMSIFDRDYETDPRSARRRVENLSTKKAVAREVLAIDKMIGGLLTSAQRSTLSYYEMSLDAQLRFAEQQVESESPRADDPIPASPAQPA